MTKITKNAAIDKIKHIQKDAKKRNVPVQKLLANLIYNITDLTHTGYPSILLDATFDTSIQLKNHIVLSSPAITHWTQLWDLKHDYVLSLSEIKHAKSVAPHCQFVVDDMSKPARIGISHHFRKPTYADVIDLVKRFFAIKHVLERRYHMGKISNADDIAYLIIHCDNVAQHGFIQEGLSQLLNLNVVDQAKSIINTNLWFKDKAHHSHDYLHKNSHGHYYICKKSYQNSTSSKHNVTVNDVNHICENILFRLKRTLAGAPSDRKIAPAKFTQHEQHMLKFLNTAKKHASHYTNDFAPIFNFIRSNYQLLTNHFDYFNFDTRADDILLDASFDDRKPNQAKLNQAFKFWTIFINSDNKPLMYSPDKALHILKLYKQHQHSNQHQNIKDADYWLKYVQSGHCLMFSDYPLRYSAPISKQLHKVTTADIKYVLVDLYYAMKRPRMMLNWYHKWLHLLVKSDDNLSRFKNTLISYRKRASKLEHNPSFVDVLADFLMEDIDTLNHALKSNHSKPYHISSIKTSCGYIVFLNDIIDANKF